MKRGQINPGVFTLTEREALMQVTTTTACNFDELVDPMEESL
jgi:hypothetical protein